MNTVGYCIPKPQKLSRTSPASTRDQRFHHDTTKFWLKSAESARIFTALAPNSPNIVFFFVISMQWPEFPMGFWHGISHRARDRMRSWDSGHGWKSHALNGEAVFSGPQGSRIPKHLEYIAINGIYYDDEKTITILSCLSFDIFLYAKPKDLS